MFDSGTAADGATGARGPKRGLFSAAYMTEIYRQQIKILRDLDYVKGKSPWIIHDFHVERRQNIFQQGDCILTECLLTERMPIGHLVARDATQNSILVDTVRDLWDKRARSRIWAQLHDRIFESDYRMRWLDDHKLVLSALQRRDPEAARSAMWQHLENVRVTLLTLSDDEDPGFDGYLFDSHQVSKAFR